MSNRDIGQEILDVIREIKAFKADQSNRLMDKPFNDPNHPGILYRIGASGQVTPVIRGTGIRVQTIVFDIKMGLTPEQIAEEYKVDFVHIQEAMAFYNDHRLEIDTNIQMEQDISDKNQK